MVEEVFARKPYDPSIIKQNVREPLISYTVSN